MPGSGKSVAGSELATCLQIPFLSTGDVLRAGRASGDLPTDWYDPASELLSREVLRTPIKFSRGIVLDFSPVTVDGFAILDTMLRKLGFVIAWVVYVQANSRLAENRYVGRGKRQNDPMEDMRVFFRHRLAEEFKPFTLPIVRSAYRMQNLIILNNRTDTESLKSEAKRVASVILASHCILSPLSTLPEE